MKQALHLLNTIKHGGAENVAFNYSLILKELDIESHLVAQKDSADYETLLKSYGIHLYDSLSLGLLKKTDYIFVHSNANLLKLLLYLPLLKLLKIRVIYIQHLNYSEKKFKSLSRFINLICTDFIQITPITTELIKKYIRLKTHYIVNFYLNKYDKEEYPQIRSAVRKELQIEEQTEIIMFSAVFKPGKGLSDFLSLAAKNINRNWIFLIIGDGPEVGLIKEYKYSNIKWIGFVNDVEKYLIASNIYAFMSKLEMMPMALLEAMNCNKKIIAYKSLITDYCLDGQTFQTIEGMDVALQEDNIPSKFNHYDKKYALEKISSLLQ